MKLIASDKAQALILHAAFMNRERFTLTGSGLRAGYVARTFNREPLAFGGYEESVELEQVSATESDTPTAWRGPEDGLPPVGLEVEVLWSILKSEYVTGKILAHDGGRAVYRFTSGERKGEYQADGLYFDRDKGQMNFRPIRTPEQVKAEQRERAIREMNRVARIGGVPYNAKTGLGGGCEALYDAGYRKFEIVDEQP